MSDRELLELAAKVAGIDWFDEPALLAGKGLHMKSGPFWNPLIDDGDALRLAVKLGLTVVVESDMVFCRNQRSDKAFREQGKDPCAATRRAIVRAAAAMARTTQQRKGNEK